MAEVYAGFLSHADNEIGRLLDYLEESGQLDNTMIVLVSDNGASGEGGPNGSVNENTYFNGVPDKIEDNLKYLDVLGTPLTYNHYPTGWAWAFNTPFKLWKRYANYEGGTADPMIVSWPARITETGVRRQYTHAIDIVPTIYECLGIEPPEVVKGYTQHPIEGISFAATFDDRRRHDRQADPVLLDGRHAGDLARRLEGRRVVAGGARHVGRLRDPAVGTVRHHRDPSECHDVAAEHPDKLQELIGLWWVEAGRTRRCRWRTATRSRSSPPNGRRSPSRAALRLLPGRLRGPGVGRPNIRNRSYTIAVEVTIDTEEASGVLFSHGARFGGHALYIKDGKLKYVYNWVGLFEQIIESTEPMPDRPRRILGVLRPGRRHDARRRHPDPAHRRQASRRRPDQDPAGQVLDRGRGLNIGKDSAEPVTDDYPGDSPWAFVGGTIDRVIDVSGEPFVDLAPRRHGVRPRLIVRRLVGRGR